MQRVRIILRTNAPLVRPGIAVFIHPAVDQVAVKVSGFAIARVRAEQEIALGFDV